jgi:release factor glutamine methyltransferase
MTIDQALKKSTQQLAQAGISSARLDCLILLEDLVQKDRAWLLSHPEHALDHALADKLQRKVKQRSTHEPLAYIRHQVEFYGRKFYIDNHVLVPRPESEAIIDSLKEVAAAVVTENAPGQSRTSTIIDIGTGSGALAISAKLEVPHANVLATDIDPECLRVAQKNATQLGADINFIETDLLNTPETSILLTPDIILANLPYVPDDFSINTAAGHEPRLAIFGGTDGLELYRRMFVQIKSLCDSPSPASQSPQYIITETLPSHHEQLALIAKEAGYDLSSTAGFVQVFSLSNHKQ